MVDPTTTTNNTSLREATAIATDFGTSDTQANTLGIGPALLANNTVEATRKKPALGDVFRFQPNNCAEWSVFSSLIDDKALIHRYVFEGTCLEKNTVRQMLVLSQQNRMFVLHTMPSALRKKRFLPPFSESHHILILSYRLGANVVQTSLQPIRLLEGNERYTGTCDGFSVKN